MRAARPPARPALCPSETRTHGSQGQLVQPASREAIGFLMETRGPRQHMQDEACPRPGPLCSVTTGGAELRASLL